jgi:hypothetical protein
MGQQTDGHGHLSDISWKIIMEHGASWSDVRLCGRRLSAASVGGRRTSEARGKQKVTSINLRFICVGIHLNTFNVIYILPNIKCHKTRKATLSLEHSRHQRAKGGLRSSIHKAGQGHYLF